MTGSPRHHAAAGQADPLRIGRATGRALRAELDTAHGADHALAAQHTPVNVPTSPRPRVPGQLRGVQVRGQLITQPPLSITGALTTARALAGLIPCLGSIVDHD